MDPFDQFARLNSPIAPRDPLMGLGSVPSMAALLNQYVRNFGANLVAQQNAGLAEMFSGLGGGSLYRSSMPDLRTPLAKTALAAPTRNRTGWVDLANEMNIRGDGLTRSGIPREERREMREDRLRQQQRRRDPIGRATSARGRDPVRVTTNRSGPRPSDRANANADGGSFTHGDIDKGTKLTVDVSGGRTVARDKRRY